MTDVPDPVRRLAEERERARRARDFGRADELREHIRESGYSVTDTADGPVVSPIEPAGDEPTLLRPGDIVSVLDRPATADATVHWIVEGWPEDVRRGIESFDRFAGGRSVRHVVVDVTGLPSPMPDDVEVVALVPGTGWAAARNAGLTRSTGRVIVVADGSVEATGDVLGPLTQALSDPDIGLTGPFGIVTDDLREFHESIGPDVDAVETYLMAFRRELLVDGVAFDPGFRFYRSADIELSFQVKARGLRAVVTPVQVVRHEHRMWANTPEVERARLSKRNFYRFLDRWRGRTDLLVGG